MQRAQTLTIVIPTRKPWPGPRLAVSAALAAAAEVGGEVILATGHPDGAPDEPIPGVQVVTAPSPDVFSARSSALSASSGDIVAILEDHCYPPPGWATKLMAVWQQHPEAAGVVGTMDNGAPALIDSASFLLTWAPFIGPIAVVPGDRCPAPGVVSYRRDELATADGEAAGDGWLEYDLPVKLRGEGRLVAATSVRMSHIQQVGWRGFALHYWSGRSFTGLDRDAPGPRRERLRRAASIPRALTCQTRIAVRNNPEWSKKATKPMMAVVICLAWCNGLGQIVGVLTGSPGAALSKLE